MIWQLLDGVDQSLFNVFSKSISEMKKAIVYIDGFNLYYGLKEAYGHKYKWLDIQALGQSFIDQPDVELILVRYFTSIVRGDKSMRYRQKQYLDALKIQCQKLKIEYGHFLYKDFRCRACRRVTKIPEEKKTDVNIASKIINDAYDDLYDVAYLVSGDSDLAMPVKIVIGRGKKIIIANPPKRKSNELNKIASGWFSISKTKLKYCQLPEQILVQEKKIICPEEWR